jgi:dephospho-CoA kinase
MLRVGLTGSIAVGKTFVTSVLAELGCHVLDADDVARQVVMPGSSTLEKVAEEFGADVLLADGSLDRARMGAIVFGDPAKRLLLNSILHPSIIAEQDRMLLELEKKDPNGIAVVDAALMIESGGYKRFDKLIVVHCKPEVQLQRLMARSNLTREEAQQRINSQMSQEEKKSFADYLIDTTAGFDETRRQVLDVHKQLTGASRNRKES